MLDNAIFQILVSTLSAGMTALGHPVAVKQSNQPTQQGANTLPTIYLYKIGPDKPRGWPEVADTWSNIPAAVFTGSVSGTTLTVAGVTSGALAIGQFIEGTGVPENTYIIAFDPGSGTYTLTESLTISPAEAMTAFVPATVHTETQPYETMFQASALAIQDPKNVSSITASDLANYARYVLQNQKTIAAFEAQGLGLLRVTEVRNPYFVDDKDQFEANPSFDFIISHKQIIVTSTPILQSEEFNLYRV